MYTNLSLYFNILCHQYVLIDFSCIIRVQCIFCRMAIILMSIQFKGLIVLSEEVLSWFITRVFAFNVRLECVYFRCESVLLYIFIISEIFQGSRTW